MLEEILLNSVLGVKNQRLTEHNHLTPWNSPPPEANGSLASREIPPHFTEPEVSLLLSPEPTT